MLSGKIEKMMNLVHQLNSYTSQMNKNLKGLTRKISQPIRSYNLKKKWNNSNKRNKVFMSKSQLINRI